MDAPHRAMVAALALSLALAGCGRETGSPETPTGGLGAPIGTSGDTAPAGLLGSQAASGGSTAVSAVAGTLAGGYLGSRLGNRFDEDSRVAAAQAERRALETDRPAHWSDAQAGASGNVRPLRSFTDAAGRECREYSHAVNIKGRRESGSGIACRESDGSWSLVGG